MTKHPDVALVEVLHVGSVVFSGVTMAFQKVGLGNSAPRLYNRFRLTLVGSGRVVTVTNLVDVYLKDIDRGEVWFFKKVDELQIGAEGGPLVVKGDDTAVGDVAATRGCLRSMEITE